jgi:hypothetical protein
LALYIDLVVFVDLFELVVVVVVAVSMVLVWHHDSMDCTEWNERETNQDEVQCCRPLSIYFLLITHNIYHDHSTTITQGNVASGYIYIYIIVDEIYRYLLD